MDDEIRKRIASLSDDQLQELLTVDAHAYRPEVIEMANEERVRRGFDPVVPEQVETVDAAFDCLRCKSDMVFAGRKRFHEGMRFGVLGGVGELLVNREYFDLWVCRSCGHVEFFADMQR
ncbi:MAG: hypothetical protein KFH87_14300 [Bacteroidetes bacterium]|nr:hypothetical protein [Bacteroidota bacterium]